MTKALLIMGPTASGKSALALALAERIGGEIVNADSMQVYRDLRVLTARPTPEEESRAPHHLYGHVDAGERYSVGRWLADVRAAIAAIGARGAAPIVVGGTGLYFKALTEGLRSAPATSTAQSAAWTARLAQEGAPALHAELMRRDPAGGARLNPNDAPRILRALMVLEATGAPLASFAQTPALDDWVGYLLVPERAVLHRTIEARFAAMLAAGALEEVRALAARGLDPAQPAMKAHGVPALIAHIRGALDLDTAAGIAARDTRRYAKRQFTWMANQMPGWSKIEAPGLDARLAHLLSKNRASG